MRGQTEGKLTASGVTHDDNSLRVQVVFLRILDQKLIRRTDVFKRSGPGASFVSYTPIFQICAYESLGGRSCAQVARVLQPIFRAPESPMNINQQRMRFLLIGG